MYFILIFHGWFFILRSTIIARKKKENIGNTQYRGKDRQHRETMPVLLYIIHISHEWHVTPVLKKSDKKNEQG